MQSAKADTILRRTHSAECEEVSTTTSLFILPRQRLITEGYPNISVLWLRTKRPHEIYAKHAVPLQKGKSLHNNVVPRLYRKTRKYPKSSRCTRQFEMHLPRKEKKTAATYRQMKNATSTQADTWERNNGQEKTKGLLRMTYVSWTSWRSDTNVMHSNDSAQHRKYVRCCPGDELSKVLLWELPLKVELTFVLIKG